jgi:hypothetical protein
MNVLTQAFYTRQPTSNGMPLFSKLDTSNFFSLLLRQDLFILVKHAESLIAFNP